MRAAPGTILFLTLPLALNAQERGNSFNWRGALRADQAVEISGVNGGITAEGYSGREVVVEASKRGRRSDPASVRFEVVEHPGGVTICAIYPSPGSRPNECLPGGRGRNNTRDNDVEVEWTVRVPAGVRLVGRTVNGPITGTGLAAPAEANTVNGAITLETDSWAGAATVNGSITVRMGRADWDGARSFTTVNGGITVYLPGTASFEVHGSTVNGSLSTDFPVTIQGRFGPRRIRGQVGEGGRRLELNTVNGGLELRKIS